MRNEGKTVRRMRRMKIALRDYTIFLFSNHDAFYTVIPSSAGAREVSRT